MLTDRFIRNASAGVHADKGGLYLRVHPTGRKTWVVRDRRNKRDRWITMGDYPEIPLVEARLRCTTIKTGVTDSSCTLADAFERYYAHLSRRYRRPEQVKRMFDRDVLPHLGTKAMHRITRLELTDLLQDIVDRGSPSMANHLLGGLRQFFDFCEQRGIVANNPLLGVKRANIGGKSVPRNRTLSFDEIEKFMQQLRRMQPGTAWALYMCLLTGKRASEVLSLRLDPRTPDRMTGPAKTIPYVVPLTPHVRALMRVKPEVPQDHRVLSHALRRRKVTFTPHDLRRTFASRLADLGVMPHVVEKLLDHQMEGVMAVYNRAEYWPERVQAMHLWGRTLAALRRKKPPE